MLKRMCGLCGSDDVSSHPTSARLLADLGVSDDPEIRAAVLRCEVCGFVFSEQISAAALQRFYEQMSTEDHYYAVTRPEFGLFQSYVGRGAAVLDWGCGSGNFAGSVKAAGGIYLGVDFAGPAIAQGVARGLRILSVDDFMLIDETFDLITLNQVLEHHLDPIDVVLGLVKRLRPGGRIAVSVPNPDSPVIWASGIPLEFPPHHLTRWRDTHLRALANICDLKVVGYQTHPLSLEHAGLWLEGTWRRALRRKPLGYRPVSTASRISLRLGRVIGKPLRARCIGLYHSIVMERL